MLAFTGLLSLIAAGVVADAFVRTGLPFGASAEEDDADSPGDNSGAGQGAGDLLQGDGGDGAAGQSWDDLLGVGDPLEDSELASDLGEEGLSEWDFLLLDPWEDDSLEEPDHDLFNDTPESTDMPEEIADLLLVADDAGALLVGGEGHDTLLGGAGNDMLQGGAGDDVLIGGAGDDTLDGGPGNDTLVAGHGDNMLRGGTGDDALIGGTGADTLFGGYGDDLLVAGVGGQTLFGGAGDDTLIGAVLDETGADIGGANFLNGGAGDDLLIIGQGDIAHGGSGADTFVLGSWIEDEGTALIQDFDPAQDTLVLAYDAAAHPDPQLSLEISSDDSGAVILRLDGVALAKVQGGAGLAVTDVLLLGELPRILAQAR